MAGSKFNNKVWFSLTQESATKTVRIITKGKIMADLIKDIIKIWIKFIFYIKIFK